MPKATYAKHKNKYPPSMPLRFASICFALPRGEIPSFTDCGLMCFGDHGSEMVVVIEMKESKTSPCVWMGTVGTICCNMGGLGVVKKRQLWGSKKCP